MHTRWSTSEVHWRHVRWLVMLVVKVWTNLIRSLVVITAFFMVELKIWLLVEGKLRLVTISVFKLVLEYIFMHMVSVSLGLFQLLAFLIGLRAQRLKPLLPLVF